MFEVVIELLRTQCETADQQPVTAKEPIIQFLKENPKMNLLNAGSDWKISADLKTLRLFKRKKKRPDIVAWSDSKKRVLLRELTDPGKKTGWKDTNRRKTMRDIAC